MFRTNDTMLNENEVTLRVDAIYIICWKGQLSQYDFLKETLFQLLYYKENLGDQINKIWLQEHVSPCFQIYTSCYHDKIYFQKI